MKFSAIGQIILEEESPVVVVSIKLPAVHTVNQGPGGVRALHPTLQHLQNIEGSGLSTLYSPTPTEHGGVRALHLILSNTYRTAVGVLNIQ